MNPLNQLKRATPPFLSVFVLVCLTLSPRVQAVVPPPDGGYPGFTTAEGKTPSLVSPAALQTQELVGIRSLATQRAASTPVLAQGRSFQYGRRKYGVWRGSASIQHHRRLEHRRWSGRPLKQHHGQQQHGQRFSSAL